MLDESQKIQVENFLYYLRELDKTSSDKDHLITTHLCASHAVGTTAKPSVVESIVRMARWYELTVYVTAEREDIDPSIQQNLPPIIFEREIAEYIVRMTARI